MLRIEDLQVELDAEAGIVRAIDGLALAIQRGETFALVGESGCGKSMTALALMRLLPETGTVVAGDIHLDDTDVLGLPESGMRAVRGGRIGMIFQEPGTSLNPVLTVGRQMVEAIETHTALDVTIQAQILALLADLQRENGMGLLLITHDLAVVAGMAQQVALMYAGQIIEVAPAAQFFANPQHPYAKALLQALPDAGRRGAELAAIAGTVPPLTQRFDGCRFAPRCAHALPACHSTRPVLTGPVGRQVRCLLLAPGGPGLGQAAVGTAKPAATASSQAAVPSAESAPLLQVNDLSVSFVLRKRLLQRQVQRFDAVKGVSFSVAAGQTLALVGESGCGKTTTGKAIVQLLRGQADITGQALLDGQNLFDLQGAALRQARRAVQMIFQDPFASLNPRMRVAEILDEGLAALQPQTTVAERRGRIERITEQVGLRREALQRFPHEFSGGQRQRIAIARALAVQPRLIVCDEPTSALDVSVQAQILNLLRELQRELGVSYLFITHNIAVVEYIADSVAVMRAGRIVEQGASGDVLNRPQDAYTRTLLAAVPRL